MSLNPYTKLAWKDTNDPVSPAGPSDPYLDAATLNTKEQQFLDAVNAIITLQNLDGIVDNFATKNDGSMTVSDSGHTWYVTGNPVSASPVILGGTAQSPTGIAGYFTTKLNTPATIITARWKFSSYTTGTGAVLVGGFSQNIATTYPTVPDTSCHFVVGVSTWQYGKFINNSFTSIATGSFAKPLSTDGTIHSCSVYIDRESSRSILLLPDGTVTEVKDSSIGTIPINWPCWEPYHPNSTDSFAAYTSVSATSLELPQYPITKALSVLASTKAAKVVVADYVGTSTQTDIPVPTTGWTAIDTTNLALTLTVPPNCTQVLVELSGYLISSSAILVLWGILINGGTYGARTVSNSAVNGMVSSQSLITNLTPNSTYTFQWAHYAGSSGAVMRFYSALANGATMTLTPVI